MNPATQSSFLLPSIEKDVSFVTTGELLSIIGNQIQFVGIVSAIFLAIVAIILVIIGILVWSSIKQRNEAEKINREIQQIYQEIIDIPEKSKEMLGAIKISFEDAQRLVSEAKNSLEKTENDRVEVGKIKENMTDLQRSLGNGLSSLSTYQGTLPLFPDDYGIGGGAGPLNVGSGGASTLSDFFERQQLRDDSEKFRLRQEALRRSLRYNRRK